MERLIPGCKTLKELIQEEIKKAFDKISPNNPNRLDENSGTYLERQNAMLLAQLLKSEGRTRSELTPLPPSEPEDDLPEEPIPAPKPKLPKVKSSPFWR
jgi:hypothetical protein